MGASSITLSEFRVRLEPKLGPSDRPFVCRGSPLECRVFIAGINPGTPMKTNFWEYWDSSGFRYYDFCKAYTDERRKLGKIGKTKTRQRIEMIVNELEPEFPCLETNIYAKPTSDFSQLKHTDKNTKPFEFLLEQIRPQLVFVHGKPIVKELERRGFLGRKLPLEKFEEVSWNGQNLVLYAADHLSPRNPGMNDREKDSRAKCYGGKLRE